MILLVDSKDLDQTAWMCMSGRLVWAFAVLICPETSFSMAGLKLKVSFRAIYAEWTLLLKFLRLVHFQWMGCEVNLYCCNTIFCINLCI